MQVVEEREEVETADVTLSCLTAGEGPVVLALHGFPDCRETYRPIVPALVAAGYRVVMPALRGYWPSGVAKSGRHDAAAAGADAIALADHFSPREPVRLVGHDWGALASFVAVSLAPHRISHLATLAVPHPAAVMRHLASPAQLRRSWYMGLFQLPGIAERALARDDFALIDRLWRDWSPDYTPAPDEMRQVKEGIRDRVKPVLAYYRALLRPRVFTAGRSAFRKVAVPAIHLHGEDDGCVGIECSDGAEQLYASRYTFHRVARAGHFLTREKTDEVAGIVTDFLST